MKRLTASLFTLVALLPAQQSVTVSPVNVTKTTDTFQTFQFDGGSCPSVQHCVLTGYDKGHVVFFEWNMLNGGYASMQVYLIEAWSSSPLMSIGSGPDPDSPGNLRIKGFGSGLDAKSHKPFQISFSISLHQYQPGEMLFVVNPSGNRVTISTRK